MIESVELLESPALSHRQRAPGLAPDSRERGTVREGQGVGGTPDRRALLGGDGPGGNGGPQRRGRRRGARGSGWPGRGRAAADAGAGWGHGAVVRVVPTGECREVIPGRSVVRSCAVVVCFVSVPLGVRVPEVMRAAQIKQVGSNGRQQHERHNRAHPPHGDPRPASSCHRTLGKYPHLLSEECSDV